MNAHARQPLVYQGHLISDKGDDLNLTDMWKAAGSPPNKEPFNWERKEGAKFIEAVEVAHNLPHSQVIRKKAGKGGATWAHWQIAFAYAKYLNPGFHMWCNEVVRAVMEGKTPANLPDDILELLRRDDGMLKQVIHKVTVMQRDHAALAARFGALEEKISSSTTCTAADVWQAYGFGPLRCGTLWLGNRLIELGCMPEFGGRGIFAGQMRRRFDLAKSHIAMKNGLKLRTDQYIAERKGQGKLEL